MTGRSPCPPPASQLAVATRIAAIVVAATTPGRRSLAGSTPIRAASISVTAVSQLRWRQRLRASSAGVVIMRRNRRSMCSRASS